MLIAKPHVTGVGLYFSDRRNREQDSVCLENPTVCTTIFRYAVPALSGVFEVIFRE